MGEHIQAKLGYHVDYENFCKGIQIQKDNERI